MKRLATATIIRGTGECEAYLNGIVNDEIAKMRAKYERELAEKDDEIRRLKEEYERKLAIVSAYKNQLVAEKMETTEMLNSDNRSVGYWMVDTFQLMWAAIWSGVRKLVTRNAY